MATIGGAGAPNALATVAAMSTAEQDSLMMRPTLALVTGPLLAAAMLCAAIPAAAQSPLPGAAAPASSAASAARKLNLSGKVWKGDLDLVAIERARHLVGIPRAAPHHGFVPLQLGALHRNQPHHGVDVAGLRATDGKRHGQQSAMAPRTPTRCPSGSISTPGLRMPAGSSTRFVARSASANRGGLSAW